MAAAARRLNFSQNSVNVWAFSCLPGCLLSSEISHLLDNAVMKCKLRKICRELVTLHCCMWKDTVGSELRSAAPSIISQNRCLRQNMQLCMEKHRIVYMWSLLTLIGHVKLIRDMKILKIFFWTSQILSVIMMFIWATVVYAAWEDRTVGLTDTCWGFEFSGIIYGWTTFLLHWLFLIHFTTAFNF